MHRIFPGISSDVLLINNCAKCICALLPSVLAAISYNLSLFVELKWDSILFDLYFYLPNDLWCFILIMWNPCLCQLETNNLEQLNNWTTQTCHTGIYPSQSFRKYCEFKSEWWTFRATDAQIEGHITSFHKLQYSLDHARGLFHV